jgi:lipid-binding SYLF domain-containing protein
MTKAPPIVLATLLAVASSLLPARPARAGDEATVMAEATRTLEELSADPRSGVPRELLKQSEGVVLIPNMINGGLVLGAKYGRGVFLVRDSKGRWGNPVMVTLWGGTLGLQAGGQATEVLMVFRTKDTVARLLEGRGKITLGVDAGVAAGPTGTKIGAETDIEFRAEILSWARSRGLFAGAAFGGAGIRVDRSANSFFYDNFAATTFQIIEGDTVNVPVPAAKLKATLAALTDPPAEEDAPVDRKVSRSAGARRAAQADADEPMPSGRTSTRRRRVANADDAPDDPPPPRTARKVAPRKPAPDPDDADPAPARPAARKPRPVDPADEPEDPAPAPRRKATRPPATNPDDAPSR